jgi:hypothetical protein
MGSVDRLRRLEGRDAIDTVNANTSSLNHCFSSRCDDTLSTGAMSSRTSHAFLCQVTGASEFDMKMSDVEMMSD